MNATRAIFQAQSDNAGQLNARSATPAASDQANPQEFAAALSNAGAKPVRPPRGRHLPAPGNQSPPATGSPAPAPVIMPAVRSDVPVATQAGDPLLTYSSSPDAGKTTAAAVPSSPLPLTLVTAAGPAPTAALRAGPAPEPPSLGGAAAQPSQTKDAKPPVSPPAGRAAIAAAASGKTADSSATSGSDATSTVPASADAAATAQAALAALVQNTRAPEAVAASTLDEFAAPGTSIAPQDIGAADSLPAAAERAGAARSAAASMAAAVTAATKASITLAASPSAGAGTTDKHARDNNADAPLCGAPNDGSAAGAQLLTATAATDTTPAPTLKVAAGVDSGEFGQGVAERVSLMMDSNLTGAKLQVNPPALGPIEVRIALQGGHAQIWFTSHSAVTRDALESSAPKLREMLGAQGFGQVSVDISQRSFQERSPTPQGYQATAPIGQAASVSAAASTSISRAANGLLDAYA